MTARPVVFHVLPFDLARGAQVYAQALRDALDDDRVHHDLVTLFRNPQAVLRPQHALDVRQGRMRRLGFDPRAARELTRLTAVHRPVAMVAHGSEPLKYALAVRGGPPVIAFRIGVSALVQGSLRARIFGRQLRAARVVVGVSDEVLEESVQVFGVPRERCVLIPNGRDERRFCPPTAPRATPPGLIFVGHWDANKRPELFLELVERLRADGVDFTASMVGDGPRLTELQGRAAAAGVQVLGRRDDVPDLLRAASVFVLTSRMEGMPGVLVEAGLSGLPVVTTDVPGARTVLEDGVTGHVVGQDDLPALVARVRTLLTERGMRDAMGAAAVERCRERFSLAGGARTWREVLAPTTGVDALGQPVPKEPT
jgi:glycosyltransferase involved in cell wall biosynthesis